MTSDRLTRREMLKQTATVGAGLALWACAPGSTSPASPSAGVPARGGTVTYAHGQAVPNLDPYAPGSSLQTLNRAMFDTLVWKNNTGQIVPQLAESWRTPDDRTWEFKLRTGVKFHNGEPMDATAVKFSIDRFIDPKQKAGSASRLSEVDGTEVVDASTVRIHTRNPFPVMLLGLNWAFILPPKYTQENPDRLGQQPIGTGPFKFVEWQQGDHCTMMANDSYFMGRPNIDKFVYRIIPDDSARLAALKAGEIDIMQNVPIDSLDQIEKDPNYQLMQSYIEAGLIFEFDTLHGGPTANQKVRHALNYAVDKQAIIASILRGKVRPLAGQILTEGILGYNPDVKAFPYDPDKAKQLLAEGGYPNGFDITINGPRGRYAGDRDVLTAVGAQLEKVGIRAKTNIIEAGIWSTSMAAGTSGPMFMVAWFSNGDPALALTWFTSKSTLGVYYNDATYDKMVADGTSTLDTEKRKQIYLQIMKYMNDQAMALFLHQPSTFYGIKKKVQGFVARSDDIPSLYSVSVQQ